MKTFAFRLTPGQDLKLEILAFIRARELHAATLLTCVGSLTRASLRLADREDASLVEGPFEIVSLVGTASAAGGAHLHLAISDGDGRTLGGHLMEGSLIHTTAEIVIGELAEVEFRRAPDPATGYDELKVIPRKPAK
ncbi:MAG: DNA-binding protein [Oligoflexia bacterium]|nr:DNA-binding protein [Oligoflexia bacterium]